MEAWIGPPVEEQEGQTAFMQMVCSFRDAPSHPSGCRGPSGSLPECSRLPRARSLRR